MSAHARHSPSGAKRRFACHGSLTLESAFPNTDNEHSRRGTACHAVAAACLKATGGEHNTQAKFWIGLDISRHEPSLAPERLTFTDEMSEATQGYIDYVREVAAGESVVLFQVEEQVEFGEWIGIDGQFGTADVILLRKIAGDVYELVVIDAKFGHKWVNVENNPQLLYYALGAYSRLEMAYDIGRVRTVIYQPEHGGESEWDCSIEHLLAFASTARSHETSVLVAQQTYETAVTSEQKIVWMKTFLHPNPNEDDCAFCRAQATCPAVRAKLEREVGDVFEAILETGEAPRVDDHHPAESQTPVFDDAAMGRMMAVTGLLEDWITAVRAETERRLLAANNDEALCKTLGFGLELGRQGHRKWQDPVAAEAELKRMRLKTEDMYDLKLISPTTAEERATQKLNRKKEPVGAAPVIGPTQWKKLQKLVSRAPAKPSVKPLEQINKLYVPTNEPVEDVFESVPDEEDPLG